MYEMRLSYSIICLTVSKAMAIHTLASAESVPLPRLAKESLLIGGPPRWRAPPEPAPPVLLLLPLVSVLPISTLVRLTSAAYSYCSNVLLKCTADQTIVPSRYSNTNTIAPWQQALYSLLLSMCMPDTATAGAVTRHLESIQGMCIIYTRRLGWQQM